MRPDFQKLVQQWFKEGRDSLEIAQRLSAFGNPVTEPDVLRALEFWRSARAEERVRSQVRRAVGK